MLTLPDADIQVFQAHPFVDTSSRHALFATDVDVKPDPDVLKVRIPLSIVTYSHIFSTVPAAVHRGLPYRSYRQPTSQNLTSNRGPHCQRWLANGRSLVCRRRGSPGQASGEQGSYFRLRYHPPSSAFYLHKSNSASRNRETGSPRCG